MSFEKRDKRISGKNGSIVAVARHEADYRCSVYVDKGHRQYPMSYLVPMILV